MPSTSTTVGNSFHRVVIWKRPGPKNSLSRPLMAKFNTLCRIRFLVALACAILLSFQYYQTSTSLSPFTHNKDAVVKTTICKCVDCKEDKICGGLWRGLRYPGMPSSEEEVLQKKIHLVVSHCKKSLSWMQDYIEGFANIASIHVISKCGHKVEGAPMGAVIQMLPNVGRCDHSYAYFITTILPKLTTSKDDKNSIVVFLKDTSQEEAEEWKQSLVPLKSLVRIALSSNGFACGLIELKGKGMIHVPEGQLLSPYHDRATLFEFTMKSYGAVVDGKPFHVGDRTLGDFYNSLNARPSSPDLVQVCYGGIFAASTENIFKQNLRVWTTLEKALERGDNIQEGHFAERIWGSLLATPLEAFQIEALRNHSTGVRIQNGAIHGSLFSPI